MAQTTKTGMLHNIATCVHPHSASFHRALKCRTPEYRWQGQIKISENPAYMFGQNFENFTQNVQIPSGIGLPWQNLSGLANQASKTAHFVWISFKIANLMMKYITANLILCIQPISSTRVFLQAATMAFTAHKISWSLLWRLESVIEGECSSVLTECGHHSQDAKELVGWNLKQGIEKESFFSSSTVLQAWPLSITS